MNNPRVKFTQVSLLESTGGSPHALGSAAGRKLGIKLSGLVYGSKGPHIVALSMKGVEAIDGAFMEQALYAPIHDGVEDATILLRDVESKDVERSCELVARGLDKYLIIESAQGYRIAGLPVKDVDLLAIEALYDKGLGGAREVAEAYPELSMPNASIRLRNLVKRGLALRIEIVAPSGGHEYRYYPVLTPKGRI